MRLHFAISPADLDQRGPHENEHVGRAMKRCIQSGWNGMKCVQKICLTFPTGVEFANSRKRGT